MCGRRKWKLCEGREGGREGGRDGWMEGGMDGGRKCQSLYGIKVVRTFSTVVT